MTDLSKIYNITISSPIGTFHPGNLSEKLLEDGRTEITVGSKTGTKVVRVSTGDPNYMDEQARKHLKIAANFLGIAEVLRQNENKEAADLNTARRKVLREFGYFGSYDTYPQGIKDMVDTLIRTRKELEEEVTDTVKMKTIDLSETIPRDGDYRAYNRRLYGDDPPTYAIRPVAVEKGRIYTPLNRYDLTDNFIRGDFWVLLAK